MRERPFRLAGGRGDGPPLSLDLPRQRHRVSISAREPELECGGARPKTQALRTTGAAHESATGTVRPLRLDPKLARVRRAPRLSRLNVRLSSTDTGSLTTNRDRSNTHTHPILRIPRIQSAGR